MKHFFFLIALCVACLTSLEAKKNNYKYEVSITAIFQNEAPWLKEWIEYHKLIGVQHFYLYNNLSTDNYKEVLQPYIQSKIVELREWPYKSRNVDHWTTIQTDAYMDAIKKAKGESRWLAVLDLDEFVVPMTSDNLATFLKPYDNYPGVAIHWQMFGTSGVYEIPSDQLMIETLTIKAEDDYGENVHVKTILHPEEVKSISSPHGPHYKHGGKSVNARMQYPSAAAHNEVKNIKADIQHIRINHYWSRDEKYFNTYKRPRREHWNNTYEGQLLRINNLNKVHDTAILRFVPALRKNMGLDP